MNSRSWSRPLYVSRTCQAIACVCVIEETYSIRRSSRRISRDTETLHSGIPCTESYKHHGDRLKAEKTLRGTATDIRFLPVYIPTSQSGLQRRLREKVGYTTRWSPSAYVRANWIRFAETRPIYGESAINCNSSERGGATCHVWCMVVRLLRPRKT